MIKLIKTFASSWICLFGAVTVVVLTKSKMEVEFISTTQFTCIIIFTVAAVCISAVLATMASNDGK